MVLLFLLKAWGKKNKHRYTERKICKLCRAITFDILTRWQMTPVTNSRQCRDWQVSVWNILSFVRSTWARFSSRSSRTATHWACTMQIISRAWKPGPQVTQVQDASQQTQILFPYCLLFPFLCDFCSSWMKGEHCNSSAIHELNRVTITKPYSYLLWERTKYSIFFLYLPFLKK